MVIIGIVQDKEDSLCQIIGGLVFRHISVRQVVYHFGDSSDVEAYAGCAASHGFHNGVWQIVLQGWRNEQIYGTVYFGQFGFLIDIGQRETGEREKGGILRRIAAENHDADFFA